MPLCALRYVTLTGTLSCGAFVCCCGVLRCSELGRDNLLLVFYFYSCLRWMVIVSSFERNDSMSPAGMDGWMDGWMCSGKTS
ncbi:hypothetical protein BDV27DRAFT_136895 [Aspergillus caelatus]|uniref:Uncharacterized protein n=1 Tax=Aspergillus caelatus TaxID=61420 RepID=A0A5N6ZNI0_9EURO|nr:uncharacterized protein BDV27DRAFT_136895 [Aspergillus caelatus]KAE8358938.1 hypothetical protein BDV27DRAFT_136895 [Aspergillus caelatus]